MQLVRVAVSLLALSWLWAGAADAQVPSSIAGFPVANFTLASKGPVPKHGANSKYDAMGYFGASPQVKPGTQHDCCSKNLCTLVSAVECLVSSAVSMQQCAQHLLLWCMD